MFLVFSTSLHPHSKSRVLARAAAAEINDQAETCELIDLAEMNPLPLCNGHDCYSDPTVDQLAQKITDARGVLIAAPVYNFDVSASCKNLIELTGRAWNDKVIGLLCAAGGQGSYMAPVSFMNSMMLDFRCLCLPKFVYSVSEEAIVDEKIADQTIAQRVDELSKMLVKICHALNDEN